MSKASPLKLPKSFSTIALSIHLNKTKHHVQFTCMLTVRESDIVDSAVVITRRMIDEFRYVDGWIGVARNGCFEQLLNRKSSSENGISQHGPVQPYPACY